MISKLHFITGETEEFSHSALVELACKGGADWVQLRVKNKPEDDFFRFAADSKQICKQFGAKLIINDNVMIAKEILADGVHLGKDDMDPREARKILGKNFIIGGSANTMEDIYRLKKCGCNYIGIGPFRFTSTKEKLNPVIGLEGIKKIAALCKKENIKTPLIAIGGIKLNDIKPILETGVFGIAVSSGIHQSKNMKEEIKKFLCIINQTGFTI